MAPKEKEAAKALHGAAVKKIPVSVWNEQLLNSANGGDIWGVKDALKNGADVNAKVEHLGQTALMAAALGGHADIVEVLMKEEKLEYDAQNMHGDTALMQAAVAGHADVAESLIKKADVEIQNNDGRTALMMAAVSGHLDVVKPLAEKADITATNKKGETALKLAAKEGHTEVVKFLKKPKAK